MVDWLKAYWRKLLIFIIVFIVLIPVGINMAFKCSCGIEFFEAEWGPGDALGFYGAILASVATIIGVYLSIEYAQRNYREDEKNRIRPYLALTHMHAKSRYNLFSPISIQNKQEMQENKLYCEFRLDEVYIIISRTGIEFKDRLTDAHNKLLQTAGFGWKVSEHGYTLEANDYVSLPFEVDNVGSGAAIDFKLCFYRKGSDNPRGVSLYTLKLGGKIYFHIFSELEDQTLFGEYLLDFRYKDIQNTNYSQKYPIIIERDVATNRVRQMVDLTGEQKVVLEEQSNG